MDTFSELRAAWVAKGRPADPADPYWATVLEAHGKPHGPVVGLVEFADGSSYGGPRALLGTVEP